MIDVTCAWGDGPDVIVDFKNHRFILYENIQEDNPPRGGLHNGYVRYGSFDLTADEAMKLSYQLKAAAQNAKKLDSASM